MSKAKPGLRAVLNTLKRVHSNLYDETPEKQALGVAINAIFMLQGIAYGMGKSNGFGKTGAALPVQEMFARHGVDWQLDKPEGW